MNRPPLEVADLVRNAGTAFLERNRQWLRWTHIKVLLAIARSRTAALGGHIDECARCGHRTTISYNSCRNRHCPKCQTSARERWIQARRRELLPSPYVHVVFSLPPRRSSGQSSIADEPEISTAQESHPLWLCPKCGGPMVVIERLTAAQLQIRSPPRFVTTAA